MIRVSPIRNMLSEFLVREELGDCRAPDDPAVVNLLDLLSQQGEAGSGALVRALPLKVFAV